MPFDPIRPLFVVPEFAWKNTLENKVSPHVQWSEQIYNKLLAAIRKHPDCKTFFL